MILYPDSTSRYELKGDLAMWIGLSSVLNGDPRWVVLRGLGDSIVQGTQGSGLTSRVVLKGDPK